MDEEDLREQEESRTLQTSDEYAGFGSTEADATRRAGLMDLLKTSGETMGVKLLRQMGWREGQGIGPKVRRKADLGDNAAAGEGPSDTYLFAPENPPMVAFIRKTDHKGLGFEGEAGLERPHQITAGKELEDSDSFFGERLAVQSKKPPKAKESRRGAFGVGVLNDTGSDDEDPYSLGPQISYNKTIGGDKKKKKSKVEGGKPTIASSNPLLGAKPVFISKKVAAARTSGGFGNAAMDDYRWTDSSSPTVYRACRSWRKSMTRLKYPMAGSPPSNLPLLKEIRRNTSLRRTPPRPHHWTQLRGLRSLARPNSRANPSLTG